MKQLSSWLSSCAVLLCSVLILCFSFPFGVWGRMWNSFVSVPDHCLHVYFEKDILLIQNFIIGNPSSMVT